MKKNKKGPMNLDCAIEAIEKKHEQFGLPYNDDGTKDLIAQCQNLNLPPSDRLFTIEQAASLVGVSPQTLRNWETTGEFVPAHKTEGGHRRYSEQQLNELRKRKMGSAEIILRIMPGRLVEMVRQFLANFDPDQPVQITIQTDDVHRKVRVVVDSQDGLTSICKSFQMED